jgi:hypothetical protein
MAESMPEVTTAMKTAIQQVFTEYADQIGGASLVGDLIVLAECYMANGSTVMRHFDTNVPQWRQFGMFQSASQTLKTEEFMAALGLSGGAHDSDEDDDE